MSAAPTRHIVTSSDGVKIYADAVGNPANPSIVFIHGFMLSGLAFDNIFNDERYFSRYYLVRYDLRGHGRSGKPDAVESYSSQLFADDFSAVASELKLIRPVVVGWSLGTTVAADIAAFLPEDVIGGVVYLGGGPSTSEFQQIGTPYIMERIAAVLSPPDDLIEVHKELGFFSDSMFHDVEGVPWETRALWRGMSTFQTPDQRRFTLGRSQDSKAILERGAKGFPLLVMLGEYDTYIKHDSLRELLREYFTDLSFKVIEGAGHAVHYERITEVMDNISKFVDRIHHKNNGGTVQDFVRRAFRYVTFGM